MENSAISKLVIGSANFGQEYGLTNYSGKVSNAELEGILDLGHRAGIKIIDTAQAYGNSETRIGAFCSNPHFDIVTKIGVNARADYIKDVVSELVIQSCKKLKRKHLYAVLLHQPQILLGNYGEEIFRELLKLKDKNIISKIGISVYSPEILEPVSRQFKVDIVQVPFNVFDQQILLSGWSSRLKENGTEIHSRSVFLQGLLLMQKSNLHPYFWSNWSALFNDWYRYLEKNNVDALRVTLKVALQQEWIDKVVVGVDNAKQLRALIEIEKSSDLPELPKLWCNEPELINPSNWNLA